MRAGRRAAALAVLLAIVPLGAQAQEATAPTAGQPVRLRVVGHGSVTRPPDFATVAVGVETRAPTPAGALDANALAARRLIEAARAMGIAEADLATAAVSLQPDIRPGRDGAGPPDGTRAVNTVSVRVRTLDRLGEFLRRAVEGGANRIEGVAFGLAEPEGARDEAQAGAVRDARRQAEALASAAGLRLQRIDSITAPAEGGSGSAPMAFRRASGAPVPIAAGTVTVEAEVAIVWIAGP